MSWMRGSQAVNSMVEVPSDPVEVQGYNGVKTFQPQFWSVAFHYRERPNYYLVGPRLKKSGEPYGTGEEIEMVVSVSDVPVAARLDLVNQLKTRLRNYVDEAEARIAKVIKGER